MVDRDEKTTLTENHSPSPAQLVFWTVLGALSGLVLYRAANDIAMGRASLHEILVGGGTLVLTLFAVQRLARLLS